LLNEDVEVARTGAGDHDLLAEGLPLEELLAFEVVPLLLGELRQVREAPFAREHLVRHDQRRGSSHKACTHEHTHHTRSDSVIGVR
jgi:hypothetical protein